MIFANTVSEMSSKRDTGVTCKVCDRGALFREKVYRFSRPAVFFGHVLLTTSVIVVVSCLVGFAVMQSAAKTLREEDSRAAEARLDQTGVPSSIAKNAMRGQPPTPQESATLTRAQMDAVDDAITVKEDDLFDGIIRIFGTGAFLFIGAIASVGILLGWLLVIKKRILRCEVCGVVITAS